MKTTADKTKRTILRKNFLKKDWVSVEQENPTINAPAILRLDRVDYDELINLKRDRRDLQDRRSTMFFFIGLASALFMVIVAFEWSVQREGIVSELALSEAEWEEIQDIPLTSQPPPPPPQQQIQQPNIIEVPDEEILEEIEVNMDVELTEEMVVEEVEFTMEIEE